LVWTAPDDPRHPLNISLRRMLCRATFADQLGARHDVIFET
jgi:hypothetical protein